MATQYTAGLSAGQVLTAATMNTIGAETESFTPTWTSTGTAPAIGNGTLTGRYFRVQKMVQVEILFKAGSTTTFGTGQYRFALPTGLSARAQLYGFMSRGIARAADVSLGNTYIGQASFWDSSTDRIYALFAGAFPVTSLAPFTWAVNDELQLIYWYEAA